MSNTIKYELDTNFSIEENKLLFTKMSEIYLFVGDTVIEWFKGNQSKALLVSR